mmetsp:Transcript_27602/g.78061  ORF Transcript_27602/g.78061 Transcript_27602/m.78061 type:complete len:94 (+) Transcript_27602:2194-2475(+)
MQWEEIALRFSGHHLGDALKHDRGPLYRGDNSEFPALTPGKNDKKLCPAAGAGGYQQTCVVWRLIPVTAAEGRPAETELLTFYSNVSNQLVKR